MDSTTIITTNPSTPIRNNAEIHCAIPIPIQSPSAADADDDGHQQQRQIRTLAFFDIETTGLPAFEFNKTKITEISIVACSAEHLLVAATTSNRQTKLPRVLHKMSLCLNPRRLISPVSTQITALDNFLLEHEQPFNENTAALFALFLQQLQQPVCLVAHNGNSFDFPLFKRQLNALHDVVGYPKLINVI